MAGLVWGHAADGETWELLHAPRQIELTLAELCGANNEAIHAEGLCLVVDNKVWYRPTGYDTTAGVLHLTIERDEREHEQ